MRVIVAGGGIGGLTTAIALRHHGIDALVLEQAEVMSEIGAGIQIASNAAVVLRSSGSKDGCKRWVLSRFHMITETFVPDRCSTTHHSVTSRRSVMARQCTTSIAPI